MSDKKHICKKFHTIYSEEGDLLFAECVECNADRA